MKRHTPLQAIPKTLLLIAYVLFLVLRMQPAVTLAGDAGTPDAAVKDTAGMAASTAAAGDDTATDGAAPDAAEARDGDPDETGTRDAAESTYSLAIDKKTAVVEVVDDASGRTWHSAPVAVEDDELANPINREMLLAQIHIKYMDTSFKEYKMNAYTDSVKLDQYEISEIPGGYRVDYELGEKGSDLVLPDVISEARMAVYYDQMSKKEQKQINRNYTHIIWDEAGAEDKKKYLALYEDVEGTNFYAIRSNVKDFKKEELSEYFAAYGYTAEDRAKDHEAAGFVQDDVKANFKIPLTYTLDGDSLVVEIQTDAIEYDKDAYYLTDISVVPAFDAAGLEDEGYLFVPDGSGSLIYLNNGKTREAAFVQDIYGEDYTLEHLTGTSMYRMNRLNIHMPIFGMKRNDQGFLAVIEAGEALGTINADISGKSHSFNTVGASFTYLDNGPLHSSEMLGTNQIQLFTEQDPDHTLRIRYYFLHDEDATYVGMAKRYQRHLRETQDLEGEGSSPGDLPFAVTFVGAIDKDQTKFGVKYNALVPLTTYAQADHILDELKARQVEHIVPIFSGWMNHGLHSSAPTKVKLVKKLEDGMSLSAYLDAVQARDLPAVFSVDLQKVYKNKWFDGYSAQRMAPRYFDRSIIRLGKIDDVDEQITDYNINLISPARVADVADKAVDGLSRFRDMGLYVTALGSDLYSDMTPDREINREDAMMMNRDALATLSDHAPYTVADRPNAYAWPLVDLALNAPESANLYRITDVSVPVYQMVLSGLVPYTGSVLNLSEDYSESILKAAETGSGFYCMWSYEDNSLVKGTEFDEYYSLHYLPWIDQITASYRELNEHLAGKHMVDHQILGENLRCTTFDDGTRVYTNYGHDDAVVDDLTIAPRSYKILGGLS